MKPFKMEKKKKKFKDKDWIWHMVGQVVKK